MTPLLALFLAAADPTGAVVVEKEKLLVLDFRDDGVGESNVRVMHDSLAAHLSKDTRIDVLSSEDLRRALDVEGQKRALGCAGDESCLAEIAGALGARFLVYGTAGKLGGLVVVNVSLYDAEAQRSVGRETVEADELDALLPRLREAGDRLVGKLHGSGPAPSSGDLRDVLLWSGVGLGAAGLVTGVTALVVAGLSAGAIADKPTFADKTDAKVSYDIATLVSVGGLAALLVGGGVAGASLLVE